MITDTTGAPLIGVSVALKGRASVGTSTNLNGRFVLEIPEDGVLIFSMIGFETQEVPVNGGTEINLVLNISASQLYDVVVVGFGKQNRTDHIGSVGSVEPSILKVPTSSQTTNTEKRHVGTE